MRREKSCGAVVVRWQESDWAYLVIHSTQGHWTLCKGHVENGESECETARREIREETGLCVEFLESFRETITYSPAPGVSKDVVFFLAQARSGALVCQPEEVDEACFVPFAQARALLTHDSDRQTLDKARRALQARET